MMLAISIYRSVKPPGFRASSEGSAILVFPPGAALRLLSGHEHEWPVEGSIWLLRDRCAYQKLGLFIVLL